MTERMTFTLDTESSAFLRQMAGSNRSAWVNQLIRDEKRRMLESRILCANQEEAEDADYQQDIACWNDTLLDGLSE